MSSVYITFLCCLWLALILATQQGHAWRLDCSKFVFAPKCRGVAAKRAGDFGRLTSVADADNLIRPTLRDLASGSPFSALSRDPKDSLIPVSMDSTSAKDLSVMRGWL